MTKQALTMMGILLLGVISGTCLGLFIGGSSPAVDVSQKSAGLSSSDSMSSQEAEDRLKGNTLLSDRIRELEKELAEQKKSDGAKACFDFFKQHHGQINMQAFDGSLNVTPEMALILGLTSDEKKAVSSHLSEIRDEMNQLIGADKSPVKQNGQSLSYEIVADPRGKDLKDKLMNDLSGDIGTDRAEVLMDYGDFSSYSGFNDFSQGKKDVGLTWVQKGDHTQYTETTTFYRSDGTSQGSMSTSNPDSAPSEFQKYLPANTKP